MKSIPLVAVVLGILLLLASVLWGHLFPPTRTWNDEKSERLTELGSETNRLKFALVESRQNPSMHAGKNPAVVQQEYDQALEEYNKLHAEFQSAKDSPKTVAKGLRWTGMGLVAIGAVLFYVRGDGS